MEVRAFPPWGDYREESMPDDDPYFPLNARNQTYESHVELVWEGVIPVYRVRVEHEAEFLSLYEAQQFAAGVGHTSLPQWKRSGSNED